MTKQTLETKLDIIANDIKYIQQDMQEIKQQIAANYVTKDQFEPVRKLVYGVVGILLTAMVVAMINLVLTK